MHDLRVAARRLWRSPGTTAAIVGTLSLGIAAVTAVFTVVNAVVLRPLPFPDSERVVILCETAPRVSAFCVASPPNVADWARASRSIERFGVAREWPFRLRSGSDSLPIDGGIATPGYFGVVGARPALGRLLEPRDLEPGSEPVVVLAHDTWRRHFASDPGVVGRAVVVDGRDARVVGVLAEDAATPELRAEAWLPLNAVNDDVTNRAWRGFVALGRLAPGATLETARREMEVVRAGLEASYPETNRDWGLAVHRLRDRTALSVRGTLFAFLAAVCCVLLIGCANVANLLLVRATGRRRELALRSALGAGRGRIAREMLAESVLLASGGAALGLLLSWWGVRAFVALAPPGVPRLDEVGIDGRVVAFTLLVSLATVLVFGIVPALRAMRVDPTSLLQGVRTTDGGGARLRRGLVVVQVALALVLLAGAGILARGLARSLEWSPGFETRHVATVWLLAPTETYRTGGAALALLERAQQAVGELPGVVSTAIASAGPLFGGIETENVGAFGRPDSEAVSARWYDIGPGCFRTLGLPLLRGRDFEATDGADTPAVAIVNQTLARRLWPGADPVGRQLSAGGARREVVGVVADVPPVSSRGSTPAEVYWPKRQMPRWGTYLVVRTSGEPGAIERPARQRLVALDPGLDVGSLRTVDQALRRQLVSPRFALLLVTAFAAVALVLASVGLYGVLAFSVASRTREIGVRVALGAAPREVAFATVVDGLRLVGAGLAIGLAGALAAERLLQGLVPDLPPADTMTLAAAPAVFTLVALVACFIPARRASRLDPAAALRVE
jgi:putative ABC transport system permease protein